MYITCVFGASGPITSTPAPEKDAALPGPICGKRAMSQSKNNHLNKCLI